MIALLFGATSIEAQVIRGRVIDAATEAGVSQVAVEVLHGQEIVGRTLSTGDGSFNVRVPGSGMYALRVFALGYPPLESAPLEVIGRQLVEVTLRMSPSAILLNEITVEGRRRDPRHAATYEGLYTRRETDLPVGSTRIVLHDDPEMRSASRVADVLRWFRQARGCVDYYINGRASGYYTEGMAQGGLGWGGLGGGPAESVLELSVAWLEGVEFYRDGMLKPIDYYGGHCEATSAGQYSVIAVWYRRPER